MSSMWSSRWAAVGAAVAVSLGAGGLGIARATTSSGERPIFAPINPCRLADTRPAPDTVGERTSPLGPEETYTLSGWGTVGKCTLPSGTAGLALNVTAVAPTAATFLTVFPADATKPLTSNLNPTPGEPPTPNAVNVDLDPDGEFSVFNQFGSVHVVIDVVGYYDDHDHDDRYYPKDETYSREEIDAGATGEPGVRMEWVNVSPSGSVRSNSPGLDGVTVVRPPTEPIGHYCIIVPSLVGLESEASLASPQRSTVTEVGRTVSVTTTFANDCFVVGVEAFVAVEVFDNTNTKVDNAFLLFIPRND